MQFASSETDYLDESVFEGGILVSEEILDEWWDKIAEVLDFCEDLADAKWEQAYDEQLETYEDLDISVSDCFLEVNLYSYQNHENPKLHLLIPSKTV